MIVRYVHWPGTPPVAVDEDLKGKHRAHCLCFQGCKKFKPEDREKNCPRANLIFALDVQLDMTTPVWECPEFEE